MIEVTRLRQHTIRMEEEMNTNFTIKHLQDYNLNNSQERMPITVIGLFTKLGEKKKGNALFAVARVIANQLP